MHALVDSKLDLKVLLSHMHQKLSKLDRISVRNNLVYQFYEYEYDHVLDFFPTLTT